MKFQISLLVLIICTSCAREPLDLCYETFTDVRTYDVDLGQNLRNGTKDWVSNNLPNLKPYQTEFLNSVLVPSLVEELKWGLPLEVMTAQAILESGWGRSELAVKYNNFFGIKEYRRNRAGVKMRTEEYRNGRKTHKQAKFRVYDTPAYCFADRSEWFMNNGRYKDLDFKDIDCYQFTTELQLRGYATDINYTQSLNRIIKQYKLTEYASWVKRSI